MTRSLRYLIVSAWVLLAPSFWVARAQVIPDTKEWGEQFNTQGATLLATESRRAQVNGQTAVYYNLSASGLPREKEYILWYWVIGGQPQAAARAYISASGELMNNPPDAQHPSGTTLVTFAALGGKGEPKRFGLISKDGQNRVFQEVVPFPIEATDNSCKLSAVMGAPRYYSVAIHASGFKPGEQVITDTQSENEKLQGNDKADERGTFVALIFPFVQGKTSGNATFSATGAACKVTVGFPWGQGSYQYQ